MGQTINQDVDDAARIRAIQQLCRACPVDLLESFLALFALADAEFGHGVKNGYWPTLAPVLHKARRVADSLTRE